MTTSIVFNPKTGPVPLTVNLSGTTDLMSPTYSWDLGNGETSGVVAPSPTYTETGEFSVVLEVSGLGVSGIYLDTYIIDNFQSGTYDSKWASGFRARPVNVGGGFGGLGDYETDMIPSGGAGDYVCGDFDFQWDFAMGSGGGNESMHLRVFDTVDSKIVDVELQQYDFQISSVNQGPTAPYTSGDLYTTRLVRGYTLDISGNPTAGTPGEIRWYYLDNWSGGATNNWLEFADSPIVTNTGCVYFKWDGATTHGIDNIVFQAENGLPYSGGTALIEYASGIVTVGSGYSYTGDVTGEGDVTSTISETFSFSGVVDAWADIIASMSFVYPPTPNPPSGSSTALKSIRTILTNKSRYPYKIPTDTIVSKVDIFDKGRISYRQNVPVSLYFNYSGSWSVYESGVTDRYGSIRFAHPTSGIPFITNCLGIAKATVDGKEYTSNLMRYNFVRGKRNIADLIYIIDAGYGPESSGSPINLDRSTYDTFNGSGRLNTFDRMWN